MQAVSTADRLNINYDSDDSSMEVDSDSPQNNMSAHDADADADADVDAEGESIHVSSPGDGDAHASSVAGPSSFAQRDSVRVFTIVLSHFRHTNGCGHRMRMIRCVKMFLVLGILFHSGVTGIRRHCRPRG
jgi:hypothetical protein